MKKLLLFLSAVLLLAAKYIEMLGIQFKYNMGAITITLFMAGALIIIGIAIDFLDGKWKNSVIILSVLGIISLAAWYLYSNPWIHFLWNLLIFTALFLSFYKLAHYEIKKFPSFSYSFTLIYILTESISLWRGDTYPPFFVVYLTFIVPMYFVGIKKIRE